MTVALVMAVLGLVCLIAPGLTPWDRELDALALAGMLLLLAAIYQLALVEAP